jgi:hypothetical protein
MMFQKETEIVEHAISRNLRHRKIKIKNKVTKFKIQFFSVKYFAGEFLKKGGRG